jgi:hypothetical protein
MKCERKDCGVWDEKYGHDFNCRFFALLAPERCKQHTTTPTVSITAERLEELEKKASLVVEADLDQLNRIAELVDGVEVSEEATAELDLDSPCLSRRNNSLIQEEEEYANMICQAYESKITELQEQVARLNGVVDLFNEYLSFLDEANEAPITLAYAHGWRCPEKDVEKGKKFREAIGKAMKEE